MRHVILTCKNHPDLRWNCKEIAWSSEQYNGLRHLFFDGTPTDKGMYADSSGLDCSWLDRHGNIVEECACPVTDLILAPEDALVRRYE